jgi:recombination protein RecA
MDAGRDASLQAALAAIKRRHGGEAIGQPGHQLTPNPDDGLPLPVDLPLRLPAGRLSEICGSPTSGATSLALRLTATAQREGWPVVWVDAAEALALDVADEVGVDVEDLLLIRPPKAAEVPEIIGDLVTTHTAALILVAPGLTPLPTPPGGWQKLAVRAAKSQAAVVLLSPEGNKTSTDQSYVSLRLRVERLCWLEEGGQVTGWESRVTVVKNKLGPAGQEAAFTVRLGGDGW